VRYRFGRFELDDEERALRAGGSAVAMQRTPFALLLAVVRRAPRIARREELFAEVWPGTVVTRASLAKALLAVRKALGDEEESVVETVRGVGLRLGLPVDRVEQGASDAPLFIGRSRELEIGREAVAQAAEGELRALALVGEGGIGKTALADQWLMAARRAGFRVVSARAEQLIGAPAFWVFVQILRSWSGDPPEALRSLAGAGVAELGGLVPELGSALDRSGPLTSLEASSARFRLFDAVTQFIEEAARRQPLALLLDDLHWSDPASIRLLGFLAREAARAPILVIAAWRDAELALDVERERAFLDFLRNPATRVVELAGWDRDDTGRFLAEVFGQAVGERLRERVWKHTEGSPLLVAEWVHWIEQHGEASARSVPAGVAAIVRGRFDPLPADERSLLASAASLGAHVDVGLLADVLEIAPAAVLARIERAERLRLVRLEDPDGIRFAHDVYRETLALDLVASRRAELHRRAAEALERRHGDEPGPHLFRIATHLFDAGAIADVARLAHFAERAAMHSADARAFEDAVVYLSRALAVLERTRGLGTERARLLIALGSARAALGEMESATEVWWRAFDLAREQGEPRVAARAAHLLVSQTLFSAGENDWAIPLLEEALRAVGEEDSAERALILAGLARQLYWSASRDTRAALSREAAEIARRLGDPAVEFECLTVLSTILIDPADESERGSVVDRRLWLARRARHLGRTFSAHVHRFQLALHRCDALQLREELSALQRLMPGVREPVERGHLAYAQATVAIMEGRFELAESQMEDAFAAVRMFDPSFASMTYAAQLGIVRHAQGRLPELEHPLRSGIERFPIVLAYRVGLLAALADAGRVADAADLLDEIAADDFAALRMDENHALNLGMLVEACSRLDGRPAPAGLAKRLAPYRGRNLTMQHVFSIGCASRHLGLLALLAGENERAVSLLREAVRVEERMGARLWLAFSLGDLAEALARAEGRRAEAAAHLERAEKLADEGGFALLHQQIARTRARL
jgi:DNA-binding winged helix-turn-helix (wHTH) protein/tetratricopeptide (TPR) repeat protein